MTSRREFLRLAAGGVMAAMVPGACGSDGGKAASPKTKPAANGGKRPTLKIAQWNHLLGPYDTWFKGEFVTRWGEAHGVDVVVENLPYAQLLARAEIEVRERRGHDLFGFPIGLPVRFEDSTIDHADIIQEAQKRVGPLLPAMDRVARSAKTGRYFGVPDFWTPCPAIYRADLWQSTGLTPTTWDDLRKAGPALKAAGHPIGIGLAPEGDAQLTTSSLLFSYGGSIQDEEGNVTIGRPESVEAVKVGVDIYKKAMTPEVLTWLEVHSDNRALVAGQSSLIIDPISGVRAAETQNPDLARSLAIARTPAGPAGPIGVGVQHCYFIWNFSEQRTLAEQFLVDLVTDYRDPFLHSEFYNFPSFPGAVKDVRGLLAADAPAEPKGKYSVLADASTWFTNAGHPGHDNAAIDEVVNGYIVPKMFGAAARGELSPQEAVAQAEAQVKQIFDKWRERGRI